MTATLIYPIATAIPGGVFTSANSLRLSMLISSQIETQLTNIVAHSGRLRITFAETLTPDEKLILDGNTISPAGGLVAAATDKIEILVDGTPKLDNSRLEILADGRKFVTVTLQKQHFDGSPASGSDEVVALEPSCVAAINVLDGHLDQAGEFSFILGPDFKRGSVSLTLGVLEFASQALSVSFR
jgi:hypothetical protein